MVEDEAIIAMLIEDTLRAAGAEVLGPVSTVSEALGLIATAGEERALDAAVLDVKLESGTILPVADKLAALRVPFVFATGYDDIQLGRHDRAPVLVKPVASGTLIKTLLDLVGAA